MGGVIAIKIYKGIKNFIIYFQLWARCAHNLRGLHIRYLLPIKNKNELEILY